MLKDTLQNILNTASEGCAVNRWAATKEPEVQDLLELLKAKPHVNLAALYRAIIKEEASAPFGKTMFHYHMRGECGCPRA